MKKMLCGFSLVFALCAGLAVGFGPTVYAQSTKATLNTEVSTNLPDNTAGLITPAILRTTINDIIASFQQAPVTLTRASATDTILISDFGQLISYTASPVSVTLPQAAGSFANFNVFIKNSGGGTATITPTISTINGAASLAIGTGNGAWIVAAGGNYTGLPIAASGGGGGGSGVTQFNGLTGAVTTNLIVQIFGSNGTYTPTSGMSHAIIQCWGAGGGGGGTANTGSGAGSGGAGGGAGGYSLKRVTAAEVGASQVVTIGTFGSAGLSGNNAGGSGGDTSVGSLCIGKGGSGGGGSAGSGFPIPGAGGVAGTGDVTGPGMPGHAFPALTGSQGYGGFGGSATPVGAGGAAIMSSTAASGNAAAGRGSGGGGGSSFNIGGAAAGGAGSAGYVVITEQINY